MFKQTGDKVNTPSERQWQITSGQYSYHSLILAIDVNFGDIKVRWKNKKFNSLRLGCNNWPNSGQTRSRRKDYWFWSLPSRCLQGARLRFLLRRKGHTLFWTSSKPEIAQLNTLYIFQLLSQGDIEKKLTVPSLGTHGARILFNICKKNFIRSHDGLREIDIKYVSQVHPSTY